MADEMWFNYNTEISMFNKGGYVAYVALIIILLRIAKKCKPSRVLMIDGFNKNIIHDANSLSTPSMPFVIF